MIRTFGWTTSGAGLIFLAINIPSLLAPLLGKAIDRFGPRIPCTMGCIVMALGVILLRLVHENTKKQQILLVAILVLISFPQSFVNLASMAEIGNSIRAIEERSPDDLGGHGGLAQGYAFFNMAVAAAQLIGPLLAGLINDRFGWQVMTLSLGLVYLISAIPIALFVGGRITTERGKDRPAVPEV